MSKVKIKIFNRNVVPEYAHEYDAGSDLFANEEVYIEPFGWGIVPCGIHVKLPDNVVAQVCSRSGLAAKEGLFVLNAPGIIDAGYTGEIKVILANHSSNKVTIEKGDKIAQLVLQEFVQAEYEEVDSVEALGETDRGEKGFGSTDG